MKIWDLVLIVILFGVGAWNFWFGVACFCLLFCVWKWWKVLGVGGLILVRIFVWGFYAEEDVYWKLDDGNEYSVVGEICLEPDIRREEVKYVICPTMVDGESFGWKSLVVGRGRFLWVGDNLKVFELGDELSLDCKFEEPFEEDGFSYKDYLKIFRVVGICEGRLLEVQEGGFGLRRGILRWKNWLLGYYDKELLEPVSSLVNGILLGTRRGFAPDVMDDFARTGLTHIIAVSGYNVALVVLVIDYLFGWVPRRERFFVHFLFLVLFGFITGLSASVIRACVMGVLTLWAIRAGRMKTFGRVLLWCVVMMCFWNPAFLIYDVSFHLSVMATLGVVMGGRICDKYWSGFLEEGTDFMGLKEAFVMTVFAQVFTLPIILWRFDYLSLVSPFANLLVAPLLPVMMLVSVLMLGVGLVFPFMEWVFVLILEVLGRLFFWIVEMCALVGFLVLELEGVDRWLWILVYCLVLILVSGIVLKSGNGT